LNEKNRLISECKVGDQGSVTNGSVVPEYRGDQKTMAQTVIWNPNHGEITDGAGRGGREDDETRVLS
jgi:hypothetical protein